MEPPKLNIPEIHEPRSGGQPKNPSRQNSPRPQEETPTSSFLEIPKTISRTSSASSSLDELEFSFNASPQISPRRKELTIDNISLESFPPEPVVPAFKPGGTEEDHRLFMKAKFIHEIWRNGLAIFQRKLSEGDRAAALDFLLSIREEIDAQIEEMDENSPARLFPKILKPFLQPRDIERVVDMQMETKQRVATALQTIRHFNDFAERLFPVLQEDYEAQINMIREMKRDLDDVFLRIMTIKEILAQEMKPSTSTQQSTLATTDLRVKQITQATTDSRLKQKTLNQM